MTRKAGLNSNTLKLLAVVAMICQHVTIFFIPTTNPWYDPLFCFGMITAPIMCFFIAEGYYHTHSRRKYLELLLLAEEDDLIQDIMDPNVVSVNTMDDKEDVAQALSKYDFLAMPVVDKEERLVGIVTVDDAMDVIEEETTEDFEKMAAMLPSDKPYLKSGIFATWKARLPWLMILMLSATFTGMILNHYESALAACLVLNSYIPMLSGTGGNSGTQASVAVIRALSLDEVDFADIFQVLWKELRVSLLCGVCLAGANFVKMQLVDRLLLGNAAVTPMVCLVVCLTILFVVVFAKCVGCSLPILAEKIGLDPAVMASPFISTIVDATSLLIYFRFASWFLL